MTNNNIEETGTISPGLANASGKIDYPLTNDRIFHMVFTRSKKALKGLISALLHIPVDDVRTVTVINPELYGNSADDKEYRLDINVIMNDDTIIDIEMQVVWDKYWKNRTLVYLCRDMDNVRRGDDYSRLKRAVHVGILCDVPKGSNSGFYSKYVLSDAGTHEPYSDSMAIYMMDLGRVEDATEDDKEWGLVAWAKLFIAETWEEAKMATMDNEYITEAANMMYFLSSDYWEKKRAREREDYLAHERYVKETLKRQQEELEEKDIRLAENQMTIKEKDAELEEKDVKLEKKDAEIASLKAKLAEMGINTEDKADNFK